MFSERRSIESIGFVKGEIEEINGLFRRSDDNVSFIFRANRRYGLPMEIGVDSLDGWVLFGPWHWRIQGGTAGTRPAFWVQVVFILMQFWGGGNRVK